MNLNRIHSFPRMNATCMHADIAHVYHVHRRALCLRDSCELLSTKIYGNSGRCHSKLEATRRPVVANTLSIFRPVAECGLDYHVQVAEISNAGQGVWSFPVGTLQLMILSMCLNTQSPDRQQMGQVWPILIGGMVEFLYTT